MKERSSCRTATAIGLVLPHTAGSESLSGTRAERTRLVSTVIIQDACDLRVISLGRGAAIAARKSNPKTSEDWNGAADVERQPPKRTSAMTLFGKPPAPTAGAGKTSLSSAPQRNTSGALAFSLVVTMLVILLVLITIVIYEATTPRAGGTAGDADKLLEFGKWSLSVLLGAFGAWIGAGAAYFFGRENLAESSRSTEAALKIQQEALRRPQGREKIRELSLTSMNTDFMFKPDKTRQDVVTELEKHSDYWWVPVLDKDGKRTLEDVIHARVFWNPAIAAKHPISDILKDITSGVIKDSAKLHGENSFFIKAALDDRISDVSERMDTAGAVVGIIVDDKGRPTACFTRQDILNSQPAAASSP